MEVSDYLAQFDYTKKLPSDRSGDDRYLCVRDGERFLLRVSDGSNYEKKKREYEHILQLGKTVPSMPKCIDFSVSKSGGKVFTLLTWTEEAK